MRKKEMFHDIPADEEIRIWRPCGLAVRLTGEEWLRLWENQQQLAGEYMDTIQPLAPKRWKPTLTIEPWQVQPSATETPMPPAAVIAAGFMVIDAKEEEQLRQDARMFRFMDEWNKQGRLFGVYRGNLRSWVEAIMAAHPEWEESRDGARPRGVRCC